MLNKTTLCTEVLRVNIFQNEAYVGGDAVCAVCVTTTPLHMH